MILKLVRTIKLYMGNSKAWIRNCDRVGNIICPPPVLADDLDVQIRSF